MPDVRIKDAEGVYRTYEGVNEIELDTTEPGEVAVFKNAPTLQSKTATANGVVTADSGYDGLSSVTVALAEYDGSVVDG